MTFEHPFLLSLFTVFIVFFLLDIFSISRKHRQDLPEKLKRKLQVSSFFFRMFIAFAIIALSGPRWGTGFAVSEYRRNLDIVFAVDVSRSMDVNDTQTSATRLEHGLSIARESLLAVSGARFAAVVGRNKGYLAVPLSYDNEAIINFLKSLDVSSVTGRSTNLESLVETAALSFQSASPARKAIVLISDGESHSGILRNALNYCARNGIIVTTVAVGSNEGGRVSTASSPDIPSDIISQRDTAVMRMAAEKTGGIYIDANREDASSSLSSHLLSLARETKAGGMKSEPKQHRTLFIMLAILAYSAYKLIPRLSLKKLLFEKSGAPVVLMLTVVFFITSCSKEKILLLEANYLYAHNRYDEAIIPYLQALQYEDAAPYAEYGLGLTLFSIDESTTALKRFENSGKILETLSDNEHRELRYRNYYNSGIIYFENGDFNSAADAFKEALRVDPGKVSAKRNLELSLMSITMESAREKKPESRNETREIIFDYMKELEQQNWKSKEWAPEETFSGPDY